MLIKLNTELRNWRKKVSARMPLRNPSYDPKRAHEWWSRRTGKLQNNQTRKRFPATEIIDQQGK